jgi:hypothetical protein
MSLTIKWWNEQKNKTENKVAGKVAPETEFEKKLKLYEAAKTTLDKEHSFSHCDAAQTALTNLEAARKASLRDLESKGFKKLSAALVIETTMKHEGAEIAKIKEELLAAQLIEKAANAEEGVYETLWAAFEKQGQTARDAPSRKLYTSMLASLTKLEEQAAKVGESDIHLKPKYNKQEKVLASIKAEVTQARTAYNTAIQNAVTARQHALPPFTQLTPVLAHAIQTLSTLKTQGQAAQVARNSFALNKVVRDAQAAATAARDQYAQVSATYAPGTVLRDASDVKAAKVHSEDSISDIAPHSMALMHASNANTAHKRDIDTLMSEIAAIKIT